MWEDDSVLPVRRRDGRPASSASSALYRRPEGDLRVPANNIDLGVRRHARRGPRQRCRARADARSRFTWAHEHGYHSMTVDWRSVNLLSSRFWPRRGFRPQYLRLYRAVP